MTGKECLDEVWKDINNYEGLYQISNLGNVKSLDRKVKRKNHYKTVKGIMLKKTIDATGYYVVNICKCGKSAKKNIHRLVAETFIPNPKNYPIINHKDENKLNNCINNIEWCSYKYNNNYGTLKQRQRIIKGKKIKQYDLSNKFIKVWNSSAEVQRTLNICQTNIIKCCLGKRNKAGGFIWKYY